MITTKTGDQGQTTCGNQRVDKDNVLVKTVGVIDELIAVLGIIKVKTQSSDEKLKVNEIQKDLMAISGRLACGSKFENLENRIKEIEDETEKNEKSLPELSEFVIPGKNESEAFLHFSRTVCRRAERKIVSLSKEQTIDKNILKYFNRLSDYLFILSRKI
jgi:cob(I)alamin adenosyltransferase